MPNKQLSAYFSTAWHSKQASSAHALIEKLRKHRKSRKKLILYSKHELLESHESIM